MQTQHQPGKKDTRNRRPATGIKVGGHASSSLAYPAYNHTGAAGKGGDSKHARI